MCGAQREREREREMFGSISLYDHYPFNPIRISSEYNIHKGRVRDLVSREKRRRQYNESYLFAPKSWSKFTRKHSQLQTNSTSPWWQAYTSILCMRQLPCIYMFINILQNETHNNFVTILHDSGFWDFWFQTRNFGESTFGKSRVKTENSTWVKIVFYTIRFAQTKKKEWKKAWVKASHTVPLHPYPYPRLCHVSGSTRAGKMK